jgi:uncharacterized protein
MLDWTKIVGFDWDAGNVRKSLDKHGVSQSEAEQTFFNEPLIVLLDDRRSALEIRYHALGKSNGGRRLHITFTLRQADVLIRVISARDMSLRERAVYDQSA